MKITYNAPQDTLRILFSDAPISWSSTANSGVTLDYDQHGRLVGMELATASKQVADPYKADIVMAMTSEGAGEAFVIGEGGAEDLL